MRKGESPVDQYKKELRAFISGVMPGKENALVFGEGPENPKQRSI